MGPDDLVMAGRLSVAALLGGLVGLEREMHRQPAGLRTHMIVAIASCLIMLVSIHMGELSGGRSDPGRIAAQVVAGVGFLGAGAIMRSGVSVRGLTTAACLWAVAGIGLAVGSGFWKPATMATVFILITTYIFQKVETRFTKAGVPRKFVIHAKESPALVAALESILMKAGSAVREVDIERNIVEKKMQVTLLASCPEGQDMDRLSRSFSELPEVERVEID